MSENDCYCENCFCETENEMFPEEPPKKRPAAYNEFIGLSGNFLKGVQHEHTPGISTVPDRNDSVHYRPIDPVLETRLEALESKVDDILRNLDIILQAASNDAIQVYYNDTTRQAYLRPNQPRSTYPNDPPSDPGA